MSRKSFDKICGQKCLVCGGKANGFHFDVISCESCKSFFRRNAFRKQDLKCFLGGKCQIDFLNRNYCKKCRLNKCFDCGMKTELILNGEQKRIRKSIIEENRRRKLDQNNSKINSITKLNLKNSKKEDISSDIDFIDELLVNNSNKWRHQIERNHFEERMRAIPRPITDLIQSFNEMETNRFGELLNAITFMTEPSVTFSQMVPNLIELVRVIHRKLDFDIRRLIKMSKNLTSFRAMSENDQILLVKFTSVEIVITRMILFFNFQFNYWNIITNMNSNIVKLELLNTDITNTYENHKHFLDNIGEHWDSDPNIIHLLTPILLFNSNLPKLKNPGYIKLQQQIYIQLLKRYLQLKYQSETESESRLSKLLNSFIDLHILNEKIRQKNLEWSKTTMFNEPLVKEIFDRDSLLTFIDSFH